MNRSLLLTIPLALALCPAAFSQQPDDKKAQANVLEKRAEAVTKKIGELASSGKLPTSEEGIALLRQLVDELSEIRQRLSSLEGDMKTVKTAQTPSKTVFSGFAQFQYRSTDQPGGQPDAFQIRRTRLNITSQLDPRTMMRVSAEFATGANQLGTQLKDALLQYTSPGFPGTSGAYQAIVGQFALPISYWLTRGDTDREFPERTAYMQALFNGERSRGFVGKVGLGSGVTAFAGAVNALTVTDPEQLNVAPGPGSHLAALGGIAYARNGVDANVNFFGGKRAATTNNSVAVPQTDRRWLILNGSYDNAARTPFSARAEYMTGKDRVPGTSTAPLMNGTDMRAWSLQVGYRFSPADGLYARYENWDRNSGTPGFVLKGWGVSYLRDLTPLLRFIGGYEQYNDDLLPNKYNITTLRLQYRF